MTFDDVETLLKWYFEKKWVKPPKQPGNHDPSYIKGWNGGTSIEKIFKAVTQTRLVLESLSARDYILVFQLFTGMDPSAIAAKRGYSERTLRRIRARINKELSEKFTKVAMLWNGAPQPVEDYYKK